MAASSWALYDSDFFPYVFDNNESFSTLWHAHNLFHFDFFKSFGLADEAYSKFAAAHPYVHTHQGNWPRIFGFLIYALGARSIESQIVVTTMTIGIASIFLAYHFFSRTVSPLFSVIICLLLITNYIGFFQWQLVSYRVWHSFFFFSTLLCLNHTVKIGGRTWVILTFLNAACLFYYELTFAAFTSASAFIFISILHWKQPKRLLLAGIAQAAGGITALGILSIQLISYLGWEGFKKDIYFTFFGRNAAGQSSEKFFEELSDFYNNNNIAFWFNFLDGSKVLNIRDFILNSFGSDYRIFTPFFSFLLAPIFIAWVFVQLQSGILAALSRNLRSRSFAALVALLAIPPIAYAITFARESLSRDTLELALISFILVSWIAWRGLGLGRPVVRFLERIRDNKISGRHASIPLVVLFLTCLPIIVTHESSQGPILGAISITFFLALVVYSTCLAVALLLAAVPRGTAAIALAAYRKGMAHPSIAAATLYGLIVAQFILVQTGLDIATGQALDRPKFIVISGIGGALATLLVTYLSSGKVWKFYRIPVLNWLFATLLVKLVVILISNQNYIFTPNMTPIWESQFENWALPVFNRLAIITCLIISCYFITSFYTKCKRDIQKQGVNRAYLLFVSSIIGFSIAYISLPGYILTGYQWRNVPLTIFFTAIPIAIAIYVIASIGLLSFSRATKDYAHRKRHFLGGAASIGIVVFAAAFWASTQSWWVSKFPTDSYAFLFKLQQPPYKGASFVGNGYMAPVAAMTGKWAYYDPGAINGLNVLGENGYVDNLNKQYIWFRDKKDSQKYLRPEYFLCAIQNSIPRYIESEHAPKNCFDYDIFRMTFESLENEARIQERLGPEAASKPVGPAHKLVDWDKDGLEKNGNASWAIVKLDWAQPPYLAYDKRMPRNSLVEIRATKKGSVYGIEYDYSYEQKYGIPESHSIIELVDLGKYTSPPSGILSVRRLNNSQISLRWGKFEGAEYYRLDIEEVPSGAVQTIRVPGYRFNWTIDHAKPSAAYTFRVRACNFKFCAPTPEVISAPPLQTSTPEIGWTELRGKRVGPRDIFLSWDHVPNATSYRLEMKSGSEGYQQIGTPVGGIVDWRVGNVTPQSAYRFRITACQAGVCAEIGSISDVEADIDKGSLAPEETDSVTLRSNVMESGDLRLSWDAIPGATAYYLAMRGENEENFKRVARLKPDKTSWIGKKLSPLTQAAEFRLQACRRDVCLAPPASTIVLPPNRSRANLFTSLQGKRTTPTTVQLNWAPPPAATEYRISMNRDGGTFTEIGRIAGTRASYLIGDVAPGATYAFKLIACNSKECAQSPARTEVGPMKTPAENPFRTTAQPLLRAERSAPHTIRLSWKKVRDIDSYRLASRIEDQPFKDLQRIPPDSVETSVKALQIDAVTQFRLLSCQGDVCHQDHQDAMLGPPGLDMLCFRETKKLKVLTRAIGGSPMSLPEDFKGYVAVRVVPRSLERTGQAGYSEIISINPGSPNHLRNPCK